MGEDVRVDFQAVTLRTFDNLFASRARELIVYGGAGAGKSYAVAQKLIIKALMYPGRRILVVRKYGPSLKLTCWKLVTDLLKAYKIPFKQNLAELTIKLGESEMIFLSVVNTSGEPAERIKSLTDITDIWIEEATELSQEEFQQIRLRMRGERLTAGYRQFILTFNPVDKNHWIYRYFFEGDRGERLKYTYRDNPHLESEYCAELEALREIDQVLYDIYALGEWGSLGNIIFTGYEVREFDHPLHFYDEVIAGVDYAFEKPSAWVAIGLRESTAFIFDEIYERKLINSELIEKIATKEAEWKIAGCQLYADTAEPGRIEEMYRAGLNVLDANKNVTDGINSVKSLHLVIHPRCVAVLKEIRGYVRKKDRAGNVLDEPVKANDHTMDAIRYALHTHRLEGGEPYEEELADELVDLDIF